MVEVYDGALSPKGRNWSNTVIWDDLAKFYAAFTIIWTVVLCAGMIWLVCNRRLSFLRIRNIPLAIVSTSLLQLYLIKIVLAYTTNGNFSCSAEYWIMGVYLPLGIAAFQANMMQLESLSQQQRKLLDEGSLLAKPLSRPRGLKGLVSRLHGLTTVRKIEVLIGIGLVVQLIVTGVIYATSPTLQGDWSTYGNISFARGQAECRKSAEWIPTAFWQLFISWIWGPIVLYKIRKVRDVHYWRVSIIVCVISGLPGAPLWIASVFSPAFAPVNKYWVPPMWLAPGIIVMQAVTIFVPIFEAHRNKAQLQSRINIINAWEERKQSYDSDFSSPRMSSSGRLYTRTTSSITVSSYRSKEMYTMAALEKALAMNPRPLLEFAATKDFTGENIVFLIQCRQYRAAWTRAHNLRGYIDDDTRSTLFNMALNIYVTSIHEKKAEFPINIDWSRRNQLNALFETAVTEASKQEEENDPVAPFQQRHSMLNATLHLGQDLLEREDSDTSIDSLWEKAATNETTTTPISSASTEKFVFIQNPIIRPLGKTTGIISADFNEHVFDATEQDIKYLVLTNTWPKFVDHCKDSASISSL